MGIAAKNDKRYLLSSVVESCTAFIEEEEEDRQITINTEALAQWLATVEIESEASRVAIPRFPLAFDTTGKEINCLALYHLLNFGSYYWKDMCLSMDRDSMQEVILYGIIGMHISMPHVNAQTMANMSIHTLASYFNIPLEVDEELSPGIYISKRGPLKAFAEALTSTLNDTGSILIRQECLDLGDFILKKLAQQMTPKASVEVMIKELATTFPAFQDHMKIEKTLNVVSFLDKAQHLMSDLYFRFRDETDVVQSFDFSDMNLLTCSSDPDTCSYLRGLNILEIKTKLASQLDRDVELSQDTWIAELRASCVYVGALIQKHFDSSTVLVKMRYELKNQLKLQRGEGNPKMLHPFQVKHTLSY